MAVWINYNNWSSLRDPGRDKPCPYITANIYGIYSLLEYASTAR
jgi:hypothetical protein